MNHAEVVTLSEGQPLPNLHTQSPKYRSAPKNCFEEDWKLLDAFAVHEEMATNVTHATAKFTSREVVNNHCITSAEGGKAALIEFLRYLDINLELETWCMIDQ